MNPTFCEDDSSQVPALLLLQRLGYTYLSPAEALVLRGGKTSGVLLGGILRQQLHRLNAFRYKDRSYPFSETNLSNAIYALQDYPLQEGYLAANQHLYNLFTLGKSFEETVLGDKKSHTLRYIDWQNPANNVFHVTEELSVQRSNRADGTAISHYRPDVVLYVNGIPLVVIECKSPKIDKPLAQAISQHLRNQNEDGIRGLYVYALLCMALAESTAQYATNATKEEFWGAWREQYPNRQAEENQKANLQVLKNESMNEAVYRKNLRRNPDRKYATFPLGAGELGLWSLSAQDELLYNNCRPERLFDLIFNFTIYDEGAKIIARYQQYFGVRKTLDRLKVSPADGEARAGGVIWHTQGSGKSYTMVMLAQLLASEKTILNSKIILVTDRVELDDQIYQTFKKCDKEVVQAKTGNELIEYLSQSSDAVVTTLINKFDAAFKKQTEPLKAPNVFVLVDEGHRTQYGTLNVKMRRMLPTACFIAFTGTPLMKKEKNTAAKFGGIIDSYTVSDAVADGAVVPLLFEGRAPLFNVNERPLDNYFNKISEPLNHYQRADLKRKFSRQEMLTTGEQIICAKAWDISQHFKDNWQGTGFKGQLVAPNKLAAVRYKRFLDQVGMVSSEVLVSPPDDREGSEDAYGHIGDEVLLHWKKMMNQFGNPKNYDESLRRAFKYSDAPEIIIVVDKLLTGFDNPRNVVLYLCRNLREHTLFQAITRVNRKHSHKDFGYIIDYDGVIEELNRTLERYTTYEDYDNQDLANTITNIADEIAHLPQAHSVVWDSFKTISNKSDSAAYENLLADEALRTIFFERLSRFTRLLKMAFSSYQFVADTPELAQERYKRDLVFFQNLRKSVIQIYSLEVDYQKYEGQIQKLIDTHVSADEVVRITEQINIFDREKFEAEVQKIAGTASKAHTIASRTQKTITEKMDEDPAFYKRFSEMIKDTLEAYRQQRIDEVEFLSRINDIKESVLNRQADDVPELIQHRDAAQAFYRVLAEETKATDLSEQMAQLAIRIEEVIQKTVFLAEVAVVDWPHKSEIVGKLRTDFDDLLWDFKSDHALNWKTITLDELVEKCMRIAKSRFHGKS